MKKAKLNKPSFFSQLWILTVRSFDIISNDMKRMGILLFLPILAAGSIIMVGKDKAFVSYELTHTNLFAIVCAVIFIGLFNSIQDICKERSILKREYMTNLRLDSYIISKLVVQAVICCLQSLIITIMFFKSFKFPPDGLVFYSSAIDGFVTIFLLMLCAAMTGILISSLVKSAELANLLAPIVILLQIVFSDSLIDIDGNLEIISYGMLSRWGMSGLSTISRLNEQKYNIQLMFPSISLVFEQDFNFVVTSGWLLKVWGVFLLYIFIFTILPRIAISRVSKDSR